MKLENNHLKKSQGNMSLPWYRYGIVWMVISLPLTDQERLAANIANKILIIFCALKACKFYIYS